ncbi:MAG: cysteine desulfurase family protein [Candidatus Aenigmatarchaeota archaeon]
MKMIYLDNAATTPTRAEVVRAMAPIWSGRFGNPGSMHAKGFEARAALDDARKRAARALNASPSEVIFTGGGTESANLALFGFCRANRQKGKHIITQKTEHHAVLDSCRALEKEGFDVTYLDVDKYGFVCKEALEKAIRDDTILVSIMYANNEIGTVQDIKGLAQIARRRNVVFHTDACQAGGALNINVKELGVDMMTLNGSKIYGPKGTGLLYMRTGVKVHPIMYGGGQEGGLRSGTENVAGIVGFATALEIAQQEKAKESNRLAGLRDYMIAKVLREIPRSYLNGHPTQRLPNNANFTILDVEGESMVLRLSEKGICASTGSACTSRSLEPSHVLQAIGLPKEVAHGSLRFSLGKNTTKADIDYAVKTLKNIVAELRKISPIRTNESVMSGR